MLRARPFMVLILALFILSCTTDVPRMTVVQPMYGTHSDNAGAGGTETSRDPASITKDVHTAAEAGPGQIALYLTGNPVRFVQGADRKYTIRSMDDKDDIAALTSFVISRKSDLGLANETKLNFKTQRVQVAGKRSILRLQQVVLRHPGQSFGYDVPIEGASVIATLQDGALVSLTSSAENPPSISFVWANPGFDFSSFSDPEFKVMLNQVTRGKDADRIAKYFALVAKNSDIQFDLNSLTSVDFPAQRAALSDFFKKVGPISTVKVIIESAMHNDLELANHGGHWYFVISKFFGLPLQFDLEIPSGKGAPLKARNLRETSQGVSVYVMNEPSYPTAGQIQYLAPDEFNPADVTAPGGKTASIFQGIIRYYEDHHTWLNYSGADSKGQIVIVTNVLDKHDIDNALWNPSISSIVVGAGGTMLKDQKNSPSILAHEFTHAVVQYTSGLVYRGQAGALNEHIADLQGAIIASEVTGRPFDYLIGADALNPNAAAPIKQILPLMITSEGYTPDQVKAYNLNQLGLRHMWAPALSFTYSMDKYSSVLESYPANCQPSVNNDYCGVHAASGVPNRAMSMVIAKLGVEKVRNLIFNTFTLRLTANSTFQDYLVQLYEECEMSSELDFKKDCPVIASSFAAVGVNFPKGFNAPSPPPAPTPLPMKGSPHDTVPGPDRGPHDHAKGPNSKIPAPTPAPMPPPPPPPDGPMPAPNTPQTTKPLKFCGWVAPHPSGNVTIIDNKFDTAILAAGYVTLTQGDYSALRLAKCACVTGSISQTQNSKGTFFNYFQTVNAVQTLADTACKGIIFK